MQKPSKLKKTDAPTPRRRGVRAGETARPAWSREELLPRLTRITARVQVGKREEFEHKLREIEREGKCRLPGLRTCYVTSNQADPDAIQIVLLWSGGGQLEKKEQAATTTALAAFCDKFDGILDWTAGAFQERWTILETEGIGLAGPVSRAD